MLGLQDKQSKKQFEILKYKKEKFKITKRKMHGNII